MGRPRKDGRLKMETDLRIPLTPEQKALIVEATKDEPEGMAAWARAILIQAARERTAQPGGKDVRAKHGGETVTGNSRHKG